MKKSFTVVIFRLNTPLVSEMLIVKKLPLLFCLVVALTAQAQNISGTIIDSVKLEPIAFANVVLADGIHGTTTDIEGHFKLTLPEGYRQSITISHVSYQKKICQSPTFKNER